MKKTILTFLAAAAALISVNAQTISITGTKEVKEYGDVGILTIKLSEKPLQPVIVGIAVDDNIKILEPTYVKGTAGLYLDWGALDWKTPKIIRYTFVNITGKEDRKFNDRPEIIAKMNLGVSSDDLKWRKSYNVELKLLERKGVRGKTQKERTIVEKKPSTGFTVTKKPTPTKKNVNLKNNND